MESTPGKDAMEVVEMTIMDLEYYRNIVYKEKAVFERTPTLEVLLWVRYYQTALHATNRWFHEKVKVKVTQSCLTLCDPMSPPVSSVHGILQARLLEWVTISYSRTSSPPRDQIQVSCIAGRFCTIWDSRERKSQLMWQTLLLPILRNRHTLIFSFQPWLSAHQHQGKTLHQQKD